MRAQVDESVLIRRELADVYRFYADMRNYPSFLGDVLAVEQLTPTTARWTVALPLGLRIRWRTVVTAAVPERRFAFRSTTARITTARWDVRFTAAGDSTLVEERMAYPGGRLALVALALIGKHPAAEVGSNLDRLRQVLEDGRATDSRNTMGKRFGPRGPA